MENTWFDKVGTTHRYDHYLPSGYCVKCLKLTPILNPYERIMKNGRPCIRGNCPNCGAKIFKVGKL